MPKQIDDKVTKQQNKHGHGTIRNCVFVFYKKNSHAHRYHAQIGIYIVRQLTSQTPMCTFVFTLLQLISQGTC